MTHERYLQAGLYQQALDMYGKLRAARLLPDEATYSIALRTCAELCDIQMGEKIHEDIKLSRIALTPNILLID